MTTLTATISQRELLYQCANVYEGLNYKVFVALNPGALTAEDDVADWEAEEITTGGAAPVTGVVAAATYNGTTGRAEVPVLTLALTATGAGFTFDTIVTKLEGRTGVHSILELPSPLALAAGQSRSYRVRLAQND